VSLHIPRKNNTVQFIHVYGPQQAASDDDLLEFYTGASKQLAVSPHFAIMGDFNAPIADKHLNTRSTATNLLTQLIDKHSMHLSKLQYEGCAPVTFIGPSGGTSVIDHVLTSTLPQFHANTIATRLPLIKSGHAQLITTFVPRERLPTINKGAFPPVKARAWPHQPNWDSRWSAYTSIISTQLGAIAATLTPSTTVQSLDETWSVMANALITARADSFLVRPPTDKARPATNRLRRKAVLPCISTDSTEVWRNLLWSSVIHEFATDADRASLLNLIGDTKTPSDPKPTITVTTALATSIHTSPSRFWALLRRIGHQPSKSLPQSMQATPNSTPSSSEDDIAAIWRVPFSRPAFTPTSVSAKVWAARVESEVTRWLLLTDTGAWGSQVFLMKDLKAAIQSTKDNGSPGLDYVTCQMIRMAGPDFQTLLLQLLNRCFASELLPSQFLLDIIVPLFKRGSRYLASNYRPISLMLVIFKIFQKMVYNRVEEHSLTLPHGGLAGPYQFGSLRGRDRLLLLWSLNACCSYQTDHGGTAYVAAWDVSNAFPSLWQHGVSWCLWKKGVRGKIWRVMHMMECGLSGYARINGHLVKLPSYQRGGNQGAVSMPHRWKYLMAEFFEYMVTAKQCVTVNAAPIPGFGFVDDVSMVCTDLRDIETSLKGRRIFGNKHQMEWKPTKDQYLQRGGAAPTHEAFSLSTGGNHLSRAIITLGEWLGPLPHRSPTQVSTTVKSMRRAARSLEWLIYKGSAAGPEVISMLFSVLVESLARAHIVLTDVTPGEYDTFDAIRAKFGKGVLGVSNRTSRWAIFGELGWYSTRCAIYKAKLNFYGRLMRREAGPITSALLDYMTRRFEADPTAPGFLASTKKLLDLLGLNLYWDMRPFPSKAVWKEAYKRAAHKHDVALWEAWRSQNGETNGWLHLPTVAWGPQPYTAALHGHDLALRASIRLGVSSAGASKLHDDPINCRFCVLSPLETAQHLLCDCPAFDKPRSYFWSSLGTVPYVSVGACWSKYTDFTMASTEYLRAVDEAFTVVAGRTLRGSHDRLQPPVDDPDAFEASLRETARWVLADYTQ
jgi:hypothetical protein